MTRKIIYLLVCVFVAGCYSPKPAKNKFLIKKIQFALVDYWGKDSAGKDIIKPFSLVDKNEYCAILIKMDKDFIIDSLHPVYYSRFSTGIEPGIDGFADSIYNFKIILKDTDITNLFNGKEGIITKNVSILSPLLNLPEKSITNYVKEVSQKDTTMNSSATYLECPYFNKIDSFVNKMNARSRETNGTRLWKEFYFFIKKSKLLKNENNSLQINFESKYCKSKDTLFMK